MIETTGNDLVVIASDPQELVEGQHATIEKVRDKERAADIERRQAQATLDAGVRAGINTGPIKSLVRKAEHRVQFLGKVREALDAGYVIVPNFPGETVAIRVKRDKPRPQFAESTYSQRDADRKIELDRPDVLPVGEGKYVNPEALIQHSTHKEVNPNKPGEMQTVYQVQTAAFADEIGLPVDFLRPTVVERTGKCMARKIFDEIAISQNTFRDQRGNVGSRKGDPMVIGRLIDRSRGNRVLSFLVAWFVDTSAI